MSQEARFLPGAGNITAFLPCCFVHGCREKAGDIFDKRNLCQYHVCMTSFCEVVNLRKLNSKSLRDIRLGILKSFGSASHASGLDIISVGLTSENQQIQTISHCSN